EHSGPRSCLRNRARRQICSPSRNKDRWRADRAPNPAARAAKLCLRAREARRRRSYDLRLAALGFAFVFDGADAVDLDAHDVAGLEIDGRRTKMSDTGGCAREDDVARLEREGGRQMLDLRRYVEDHVVC